ncbi:MAG: tRNA preQ1(34) S-adenosylmethionine ribosyltransferase-isomerase QueA [Lautropia sp.]|nr:tRNA preQ1(34) S-adenosylmethionine ribosyltransferase-isomerase QueA [Lautropia sp.]
MMKLSDFDYQLPEDLIAQHPPEHRTGGRLLDVAALHPASSAGPAAIAAAEGDIVPPCIADRRLTDLPELISPGSLLIFNDTRVLHARLTGHKESGGRIEVMVERLDSEHEVLAMVRASHPPRTGTRIHFDSNTHGHATTSATVVSAREAGSMLLRIRFDEPAAGVLERMGELPLPPYIQHQPGSVDETRYQTVFARNPGAVAAPTAGLHFDDSLLNALKARGANIAHLTLHVGAGTFLPVRTNDLSKHHMHAERYHIPAETALAIARAKKQGQPVVAVGTTVLRALEASNGQAGEGETDLFITPGYPFRVVDRLLTNFHLPKSTLLILVSAFAGRDTIRRAYAHAIAQRYRFFSYGDAMLLDRSV